MAFSLRSWLKAALLKDDIAAMTKCVLECCEKVQEARRERDEALMRAARLEQERDIAVYELRDAERRRNK